MGAARPARRAPRQPAGARRLDRSPAVGRLLEREAVADELGWRRPCRAALKPMREPVFHRSARSARPSVRPCTLHPTARPCSTRYVAAIQAGDDEAIRDCFAEDATWTLDGDLPISGTWRGRDTILGEFLAAALEHYEPGSINLEVTGMSPRTSAS